MTRRQMELMLATRLSPTSRAWRQLADVELAELRLSNATSWCLIWLDRLGPDLRQIDLARAMEITQPSLVRTLNQLEASGLIRRVSDPDDRRTNKLQLTEEGQALASRIETRLRTVRAELLSDLSDEDIAAALRVCDVLSRRIAERRQQS